MNTANKILEKLKNANLHDVCIDENPDSAYETFFKYTDIIDLQIFTIEKSQTKHY